MKKRICLLLLLSAPLYHVLAHKNAQALKILERISHPDTFQATFVYIRAEDQQVEPPEEYQKEVAGQVMVKGNKYHLTLGEQVIINNGETVWTYLPEANEVHISSHDPKQEELTPIKLLTIYRQGFLPIALRSKTINNQSYDVVDLIAEDKEGLITQISLAIERKTRQLSRLEAWDSNHTLHTFLITAFEPDVELNDTYFDFNQKLYDEVEIIDLR